MPFAPSAQPTVNLAASSAKRSDHRDHVKSAIYAGPASKKERPLRHWTGALHSQNTQTDRDRQCRRRDGPWPRSSYQHALSKYPEMREVAKQLEALLRGLESFRLRTQKKGAVMGGTARKAAFSVRSFATPHLAAVASPAQCFKAACTVVRSLHLSCILLQTRRCRCNEL